VWRQGWVFTFPSSSQKGTQGSKWLQLVDIPCLRKMWDQSENYIICFHHNLSIKTLSFYFCSYFEGSDLPQQKIPRELCSGGRSCYVSFCVPMFLWKDFLMGWDQENSKDQERKNGGKKKKRLLPTTKSPLHTYI